jgi:ethanolamine utilization microcompartment shell protein EutL
VSDSPPQDGRWRFLRVAWLAYALATVALSISVLAIYVNAYDDYDLSERLRATGRFARQAMRALSFPLGAPIGALLNPPLEKSFGCADANEPCAVFAIGTCVSPRCLHRSFCCAGLLRAADWISHHFFCASRHCFTTASAF